MRSRSRRSASERRKEVAPSVSGRGLQFSLGSELRRSDTPWCRPFRPLSIFARSPRPHGRGYFLTALRALDSGSISGPRVPPNTSSYLRNGVLSGNSQGMACAPRRITFETKHAKCGGWKREICPGFVPRGRNELACILMRIFRLAGCQIKVSTSCRSHYGFSSWFSH
jgi:hypothetical protein